MGCLQVHSDLLPHVQPLTVMLIPLFTANIRLWADVLLLQKFFRPPLYPWHCCRVITEKANVFIAEVFDTNSSFQHKPCQKLSCHFQIVYILFLPWFCRRDQPSPQFLWSFQAPNFGSIASFHVSQLSLTPSPNKSTQPINSGFPMTNLFALVVSRAVSFSSVLQFWNACFADGKYFVQTIRGFTCRILLIGVINFFCWDCCSFMSNFSNQFFYLFEWNPFCHAHNILQLPINLNFPVLRQFDAPCFAINHPT